MRHRKGGVKLQRNGSARRALFRSLTTSIILEDRVVIGTDGTHGNTHALDLETGAELWRRPCGSAMKADLLGIDDRVIGIAREEEVDRLFSARTTGRCCSINRR